MSRKKRPQPALPDKLEGVWWRKRESAEQIAQRASKFFREISTLHPALGAWYDQRGSVKRSLAAPLNLSEYESALKVVQKGEEVGDYPPYEPLPWGGYWFSGWNGREDDLSMSFCASAGKDSTAVPNHIWLSWRAYSQPPVFSAEILTAVIAALSNAWDADFCKVVGSYDPPGIPRKYVEWNIIPPDVGWMIQLARRNLSPADVPSAWRVEPCGNGTLITVRESPIDMHKPEDFALADRVRIELGLPTAWKRRQPQPRLPQ